MKAVRVYDDVGLDGLDAVVGLQLVTELVTLLVTILLG